MQREATENGKAAYEVLSQFLQDDEWPARPLDRSRGFATAVKGHNGEYRCYAIVREDLEQFLFYAVAPNPVPASKRAAVAEFITRANYGMRIGNFELDYEDGELRYKSALDFENQALTATLIRNAVQPAVRTLDRYLPGLLRVIFGGASPAEAVAEVEE